MNSGATIFDDGETVNFLRSRPDLLAIADAIRATQAGRSSKLRRSRTLVIAAAIVALAAGVAVSATLLIGGAGHPQPQGPIAGPGRPGTLIPPSAAGLAEADALLPFNVVLPSDFPTSVTQYPTRLQVYEQGQQLVGSFQSPSGGTYDLAEGTTDQTVSDLEQLARTWQGGHAEIQIIDGVHVLIQGDAGDDYRTISWIRGDGTSPVLTFLQGPVVEGHPFTEQEALAIATDMISRGG